MSVKPIRAKRLSVAPLRLRKVFQHPIVLFKSSTIDFDGDNEFGPSDLRACLKSCFFENLSLGDGHCFFRVLHRFLTKAKLYTEEEMMHFKRVRSRLVGPSDIFPEIAYLRRLAQKYCTKIDIQKYGRKQPPSEDAMDYASDSQAHGLLMAKQLSGTDARGYADSPDYEACAVVLDIVICILQTDGKWQVFPDNCLENGFGNRPIMFAYNQGRVHFNALEPNMEKFKKRRQTIEAIGKRMDITQPQACRICAYFFHKRNSIELIQNNIIFLKMYFGCDMDVAIEMLHIRVPLRKNIKTTIDTERKLMIAFENDTFKKLLTYGNIETRAGFKTAQDLLKYLQEKTRYLSQRDDRDFTIDEVVNIYLNGD